MNVKELSSAQWTWTDHATDSTGQMGSFRLPFDAANRAQWTGFADTLYALLCNGPGGRRGRHPVNSLSVKAMTSRAGAICSR